MKSSQISSRCSSGRGVILQVPPHHLLSVVLIGNGQLLAAFGTTGGQDAAAILGGHALTETMLVHAAAIVRLKCSFHCSVSDFCPLS
jgi:hypothetical protein